MRDDDKKKLMERMNSLETVTEDGPKTRRKGNLTSLCDLLRHQRDSIFTFLISLENSLKQASRKKLFSIFLTSWLCNNAKF